MPKDDARSPFNVTSYDCRVTSILGDAELLYNTRENLLKEGIPERGPYGVEKHEQIVELRRVFNRMLYDRPLEDLQLVAAVRHLGRGEGGSWTDLARAVCEWYPTRDLALAQIKTRQKELPKDLERGLRLLDEILAQ